MIRKMKNAETVEKDFATQRIYESIRKNAGNNSLEMILFTSMVEFGLSTSPSY